MPPSRLSKYWMFTLNNPNVEVITDNPAVWPQVEWAVWQLERGESGTLHYQGYVIFNVKKRLSACKTVCPRAHWEPRRGAHRDAHAYCSKEDTRVEGPFFVGVEPHLEPGKRNDLLSIKRAMDEEKSEREIAEDDELFPVWARHPRLYARYKMVKRDNERNWPTLTTVYWGAPGVGKSRRARDEGGPDAFWLPKPNSSTGALWWDGYDGQEVVIIDEFYGWISRDLLCRLCDRYPLVVQTKGGATPFLAKRIIITSNTPPGGWYRIGLGAMERRLSGDLGSIVNMVEPYLGPVQEPLVAAVPPLESLAAAIEEENLDRLEHWFGPAEGGNP